MSTDALQIAIVGGGEAAKKAMTALSGSGHVNITHVVCLDSEWTGIVASATRASLQTVCKRDDVRGIYVATPVHTHIAIASRALRSGKHVLIEKPLATTLDAASSLIVPRGLVAAVAFKKRFSDAHRYVAQTIASSDRIHVRFTWRIRAPSTAWRYDRHQSGGGVLMDLGSHVLDLLEHWLGPLATIQAHADASETEHSADVILTFVRGHSAEVALSWGGDLLQRIELSWRGGRRMVVERLSNGQDVVDEHRLPARSEYLRLFHEWAEAIDGRPSAVPTAEDGIHNLQLLRAAYDSIASGERVVL